MLFILIITCLRCEKENVVLYTGYIVNNSPFTITVRVYDYETGDEHNKYYELSPGFYSKVDLEERKYYFKAYQNDGSFYYQHTLDINGIRNDSTTPFGQVCDWYVEFI